MNNLIGSRRKMGFLRAHKNSGAPGGATIGDSDLLLYDYNTEETIAMVCITWPGAKCLNGVERAQMKDYIRLGKPVFALAFDVPETWPKVVGPCEIDPVWPTPIYIYSAEDFDRGPAWRRDKYIAKCETMAQYFEWEEEVRHEYKARSA